MTLDGSLRSIFSGGEHAEKKLKPREMRSVLVLPCLHGLATALLIQPLA
jgi:hypothetical protein